MERRVKFYSTQDLSAGINLREAEHVLEEFDRTAVFEDINDVIEFYNISQYFRAGMYHSEWQPETIERYKSIVKYFPKVISACFRKIEGSALLDRYLAVDIRYKEDFWEIFCYYKCYENIEGKAFLSFLSERPGSIASVLKHQRLVNAYGNEIAEFMRSNVKSTECLIDHHLVKHEENSTKTYMPRELSRDDIRTLLSAYVEEDDANINYLQLLAQSKGVNDFPLDDRIRLKARRRCDAETQRMFKENKGFRYGIDVALCSQPDVIKMGDQIDGVFRIQYSREWFEENLDYPTLLNNFIHVFGYTDLCFRCSFLSKPNQMSPVEWMLGVHGINEYRTGIGYESSNMRSMIQMKMYCSLLQEHDIRIEDLFRWFFEEYLKEEFSVEGFRYVPPSKGVSELEKILLITSQMDAVLKEFRLYIEDGEIDRELFELSSHPYKIVETPSMIPQKYVYAESQSIKNEMNALYSDQSILSFTGKTEKNYDTFSELLEQETVTLEDFHEYQLALLKWLIERGTIFEDQYGQLKVDTNRKAVLHHLYHAGAFPYSYARRTKTLVDELIAAGELVAESSLFTRDEQAYLDYMLNVQHFTNGPELRNKYVHGTFSLDPKVHERDYLELLKIMVLIVIKINEEFCLLHPMKRM